MSGEDPKKPLFEDINYSTEGLTEIESLCMNCHEQGMTRLLLTKIPFFKEIILSSFECEHCGYQDNSIQSAGRIQDKGVKFTLKVRNQTDLNRQVVKSESAVFSIPSLGFEQPPSKKGDVTTVEGMMQNVIRDLEMYQDQRRLQDPDTASKLDEFLAKFKRLLSLEDAPFDVVLDDLTGNSFVENPEAPKHDPSMEVTHYKRTKVQDQVLGFEPPEEEGEQEKEEEKEESTGKDGPVDLKNEVLSFPTNCPNCNAPCPTNMKVVDIPYFKETVIMATTCDSCGFRDNEVKGGTGFGDKAKKIKLHITDPNDLSRDVLKSDACDFHIPELGVEVLAGASGGRFTTLEGLFTQIIDQFDKKVPFLTGDSATDSTKSKMQELIEKLKKASKGELLDLHVILDDPAGNSYLQNFYAPDPDPEMEVIEYDRTPEQNDYLGISDMKTENYQNDAQS